MHLTAFTLLVDYLLFLDCCSACFTEEELGIGRQLGSESMKVGFDNRIPNLFTSVAIVPCSLINVSIHSCREFFYF